MHQYSLPFTPAEPSEQAAFELLVNTLLRLRESRVRENLDQMRFIAQDYQDQTDLRANFDEMAKQYMLTLQRIHRALKQPVITD